MEESMKISRIIQLCLFLGTIYIAASDRTGNFYRSLNIQYTPAQEIIDLLRNLKIQLPGSHRTLDINPEGDQDTFAFDFFYNLVDDNGEIKIARTNRGPNEHYYIADSLERYLRTALQQLLDDPYRFRQIFIPKDPDTGLPITDITEFVLHVPSNLVKLQHGEAQKPDILISKGAANESKTLKTMLEDVEAEEALLPLLAYSYDLVFNVADLLKLINKNRSKSDIEIKEILINKLSDQTHPKSVQELIDLANFTNFLDIPILLDALLGLLGKKLSENKSNFYTIITGLQESNLIKNLVSNLPYSIERRIDDRKYLNASISADGSSIIAIGFYDYYLYLFKDETVTKLADPSNTNRRYLDQSISADGSSIVAIGFDDGYLYLFKDGAVTKLEDPSDTNRKYWSTSISADGSSIAAGSGDYYLYLFKDGAVTKLADPSDTNRKYWSPSISADGSFIIARGFDDGYLYLFKDGDVTKLVDPSDTNRKYWSPSISADGSSIIATGSDDYLYLFTRQAALKKFISQLDGPEQKEVQAILETVLQE